MPDRDKILSQYLEIQSDRIIRALVLQLWTSLVKYTPVDTGRARAGWSIQKDKPSTFVPPEGTGRRSVAKPRTPRLTAGLAPWFIVNNVEYIEVLDQGRSVRDGQKRGSLQAPRGMTLLAINDLKRSIRRAATGRTRRRVQRGARRLDI